MEESQSAGGIVINKNGLVLLIKDDNGSWGFPKGHINDNEDKLETAKREVYEESGLDKLQFVKELGNYQRISLDKQPELKTIHLFLFRTDQETIQPIDRTVLEAKWFEKEKVANLITLEKDKEFFLSVMGEI